MRLKRTIFLPQIFIIALVLSPHKQTECVTASLGWVNVALPFDFVTRRNDG